VAGGIAPRPLVALDEREVADPGKRPHGRQCLAIVRRYGEELTPWGRGKIGAHIANLFGGERSAERRHGVPARGHGLNRHGEIAHPGQRRAGAIHVELPHAKAHVRLGVCPRPVPKGCRKIAFHILKDVPNDDAVGLTLAQRTPVRTNGSNLLNLSAHPDVPTIGARICASSIDVAKVLSAYTHFLRGVRHSKFLCEFVPPYRDCY